jgi:hypothetical protein
MLLRFLWRLVIRMLLRVSSLEVRANATSRVVWHLWRRVIAVRLMRVGLWIMPVRRLVVVLFLLLVAVQLPLVVRHRLLVAAWLVLGSPDAWPVGLSLPDFRLVFGLRRRWLLELLPLLDAAVGHTHLSDDVLRLLLAAGPVAEPASIVEASLFVTALLGLLVPTLAVLSGGEALGRNLLDCAELLELDFFICGLEVEPPAAVAARDG